ncbi:MAG: carbonic anhydrase [Eubacteriales bacterium]
MNHGTFVTTINCIDGRVQIPIIQYLLDKFSCNYVDSITEAGPDKILALREETTILNSIKTRVDISVNQHKSKVVTIVGHFDCAGNPVDEATHKKHIQKSINTIRSWNLDVVVLGLWVDENWNVQEVDE